MTEEEPRLLKREPAVLGREYKIELKTRLIVDMDSQRREWYMMVPLPPVYMTREKESEFMYAMREHVIDELKRLGLL